MEKQGETFPRTPKKWWSWVPNSGSLHPEAIILNFMLTRKITGFGVSPNSAMNKLF